MTHALPAVLWFFVSAWWFLADGWLAWVMGAWRVDLVVAFCVFAALTARAAALPWLVLCAGLARALTVGGAAPVHVLLLGLPIACLFPLRQLDVPRGLRHVAAAAVVAVALPLLSAVIGPSGPAAHLPVAVPGVLTLLWTMATAPLAATVLGRLPPLWFFRERVR